MRRIAGPEKLFGTDEEIGIVLAPKHAAAFAKMIFDARHRAGHGLDHKESAADIERAVLVRQSDRLFGRQVVPARSRVILNIAAGSLIDEPFTNVAFVGVSSLGQLG